MGFEHFVHKTFLFGNGVTRTEEPDINVFDPVNDGTDKKNILDFCNNGELITEVRNNLPIYSRANPPKISRSPGLVIKLFRRIIAGVEDYQAKYNTNVSRQIVEAVENLSSIVTVYLQRAQATLAAVETCIGASQTVLRSAEAAAVTAQNTNAILSVVITLDTRTTAGSAMVSNAVAFNL
ncbi:hypothetical protein HPULCUR_007030 [Helicostylum pulchrum]|uniref:Uncharacterized protein n=1 Tax=Helicostylum pulchrum TaxID=562976 RepID=A0ABP9Y3L5_9FUNG